MNSQELLREFSSVIQGTLSERNDLRKAATERFEQYRSEPDKYLVASSLVLANAEDQGVRSFCAVMLRQSVNSSNASQVWANSGSMARETVKTSLLNLFDSESSSYMRRLISAVIGTLASQIYDSQDEWPELLSRLQEVVRNPEDPRVESVLNIYSKLAELVMEIVRPQLPVIAQLLHSCLMHVRTTARVAALRTLLSFLLSCQEEERVAFQDLIPRVFEAVAAACQQQDDELVRDYLDVLIDTAMYIPDWFAPHLNSIVTAIVTIVRTETLDMATRRVAYAWILNLCDYAASMARKVGGFASTVIPLAAEWMLRVEDNPEWEDGFDEDYMEDENFSLGAEASDTLSHAIGPRQFLPVAMPVLNELIQNTSDWRFPHAALMMLSQMAEGCAKYLRKDLDGPVRMITPFVSAEHHPRVRWAALNALAQLATDFAPYFQSRFSSTVFPLLVSCMTSGTHPRVMRHAALCVVDFCAGMSAEELSPFLSGTLNSIHTLLFSNNVKVQESALAALAAVAAISKEEFTPYYGNFMPQLRYILTEATGKEMATLRARAVECVGLIAEAVGANVFRDDFHPVMSIIARLLQNDRATDDTLYTYALSAGPRICSCMGAEFAPFMEHTIPQLLAVVSQDCGVALLDGDMKPNDLPTGYMVVPLEIRGVGRKNLVYNTAILEEVSSACRSLRAYCMALKEHFLPYAAQTAEALEPLVRFKFNPSVRVAASATVPPVIDCFAQAARKSQSSELENATRQVWQGLFPALIEAVGLEYEIDDMNGALATITETLEVLPFSPSNAEFEEIYKLLFNLLEESEKRREERHASTNDSRDEEDWEQIQAEDQTEDEFLGYVAGVLRYLWRCSGPAAAAQFVSTNVAQLVQGFLDSQRGSGELTFGLCVMGDFILNCSPAPEALQYVDKLYPLCMQHCYNDDVDVRQSCVYTLGIIAELGGDSFADAVQPTLERLLTVITAKDAREGENEAATDNAVSSVVKILRSHSDRVDQHKLLSLWLSYMPAKKDEEEAQSLHGYLCDFVEQNQCNIMGDNLCNMPRIMSIFAGVIGSDCSLPSVDQRIRQIMGSWQAQSGQAFSAAWATLSPEQQQAFS